MRTIKLMHLVVAVLLLLGTVAAGPEATGASPAAQQWMRIREVAHENENALAQVATTLISQLGSPKFTSPIAGDFNLGAFQGGATNGAQNMFLNASDGVTDGNFDQAGLLALQNPSQYEDVVSEAMKLMGSLVVNELSTPGARMVERLQQLGQIAMDIQYTDEACGAYTFNPGGAPVNAKWNGPSFTLTQTTGSCVVQPTFQGDGNTRWTRAQERLACLGPSTQWGWTPLEYTGVSHELTSLEGPECRTEFKFGSEVSITLHGGSSTKVKFATEGDFYAAVAVNHTVDASTNIMRTVAEHLQAHIDNGKLKLEDVLASSVAANDATAPSSGALTSFASMGGQDSGAWTYAGTFRPLAYTRSVTDKLKKGDLLQKGVGRSLFAKRA